MKKFG